MGNKYKAVVFDLDGTLLDTLEDLKNSINEALKKNGYNISYSYEEAKWLIGSGTKMLCQRAIERLNPSTEQIDKLFEDFTLIYKERQLENTKPYLHVKDVIFSLKNRGIKVCVLSNKVEENCIKILNHVFSNFVFDIVIGQRINAPKKPDPTLFKVMLKELGLKNTEVLYVGDSDVDMILANNINVDKVAVTYGYRPASLLKQYSPNYLVSDMLEILEIVENK